MVSIVGGRYLVAIACLFLDYPNVEHLTYDANH